jgi:hypothetical protein
MFPNGLRPGARRTSVTDMTTPTNARLATDRQLAFITRLQAERNLITGPAPTGNPAGLTAREASALIDTLLATPRPAATPTVAQIPTTTVPQGFYAVDGAGHQPIDFYRVSRPTEGRWAGRVFVDTVIGGRRNSPVRVGARQVLARIEAAGPLAAAQRYGLEIGRCGRCNRRLTDEVSRQIGLGPDCRALVGWGGTAHTHAPAPTADAAKLATEWFDADEPAA